MTDHIDDAFEILKHINVPESQYTKAFRFEKPRSLSVVRQSFRCVVLSAVEFNDESALVTGEVGNETRDRNLPAKMSAFLLEHAQFVPELLLGIGDIAAQVTRKVIGHRSDPHP